MLEQTMRQVISSPDYQAFLAYLKEFSNEVADLRTKVEGVHTLESRKEMSLMVDRAIDNLRHMRDTLTKPPIKVDRRADFD